MSKPRGRHRSPKKLTSRQRREIRLIEKFGFPWGHFSTVFALAKRGYIVIEPFDYGDYPGEYGFSGTHYYPTNKGRAALGLETDPYLEA